MGVLKKTLAVGTIALAFVGYKACEADQNLGVPGDDTATTSEPMLGGEAGTAVTEATTAPEIKREEVSVVVTVSEDGKRCSINTPEGAKIVSLKQGTRLMATTNAPGAAVVLVDGNNNLRSLEDMHPLDASPIAVDLPSHEVIDVVQCFTPDGTLGAPEDHFDPDENTTSIPVVDESNTIAESLNLSAFKGSDITSNIELGGLQFP